MLNKPTLFVVATPIGNLSDISIRAKNILAEVDLIAAEDTRKTAGLLLSLNIKVPLISFHQHNEEKKSKEIINVINKGNSVAIVSNAGTPLISDPGYRLIKLAHDYGIKISPIPGPSALIAALSCAGLPTDRFVFEGFLPSKSAARRTRLNDLKDENRTIVFYESVHRILKTAEDMAEIFGESRKVAICRELTKVHEQCEKMTLIELVGDIREEIIPQKGEFVISVEGYQGECKLDMEVDLLLKELIKIVSGKKAIEIAIKVTNQKRNELYKKLVEINKLHTD